MKRHCLFLTIVVASFALLLSSNGCKKESNPAAPPPDEVEHPPATAFTFVLLDSTGATVVDTCLVRDTTLVSGLPPLVGQLDFAAGKTYKGTIRLYDESTTPTTVVTDDIISEAEAHLFQYVPTDTNRVKINNLSLDDKGLTFGLNFTLMVTSGPAATGTIHVILQHHDDGIKYNSDGSYHEPYDFDLDADVPYSITP
jgi:hypothetical protein